MNEEKRKAQEEFFKRVTEQEGINRTLMKIMRAEVDKAIKDSSTQMDQEKKDSIQEMKDFFAKLQKDSNQRFEEDLNKKFGNGSVLMNMVDAERAAMGAKYQHQIQTFDNNVQDQVVGKTSVPFMLIQ